MTLLHTLEGPVLRSSLTEELAVVRALFSAGPETELNYEEHFNGQVSRARIASISGPATGVQNGGPER